MEYNIISRTFDEQDVQFLFINDTGSVKRTIDLPTTQKEDSELNLPHTHSVFEMFYVSDGYIRIWTTEQSYDCEKDSLILIPPGIWHYASSEKNNTVYNFQFGINRLKSEGELFSAFSCLTQRQDLFLSKPSNSLQWRKEFNRLDYNVSDDSPIGNLRLKTGFLSLMTEVVNLLNEIGPREENAGKEGPNTDLAVQLDYLINSRYTSEISVQEIADSLNFSPKQVNRLSVRNTGKTVTQRLIETRMKSAVNLLQSTEIPIETIAYMIGYSSQKGFVYTFKKAYGISPFQYRKRKTKFS